MGDNSIPGSIFILQRGQRIISGLIVAVPTSINAFLGMEYAPTILAGNSPKIGDERPFLRGQSANSVLNDRAFVLSTGRRGNVRSRAS